jgi:hypothetical protein
MLVPLKFIATLSAATFAGAALYVNLVEHPARMTLDTRAAVLEWAPAYARGTWMQAPLALLSLVAGLGAWLLGGGVGWARLHAVRTVLSLAATVLYLAIALRA